MENINSKLKTKVSLPYYAFLSLSLAELSAAAMSLIVRKNLSYDYLITAFVVSIVVFTVASYFIKREGGEDSLYDSLTGLPGKTLLYDRLAQAVAQAKRGKRCLAVVFISISSLKTLNDAMGTGFGNALIKSVAWRLNEILRKSDTIARPGRNEFIILLPEISKPVDAEFIADKILFAMKPPFHIKGSDYYLNACIGISVYPNDGSDAGELLKNAYTAMACSRRDGDGGYSMYSPVMTKKAFEKLVLENSLHKALGRNEFVLYYQPQLELGTGELVGMEALVRWRHPELGIVPPMDFIPQAEESGIIVPLGEWVLKTACAQNAEWQNKGYKPIRMAVNLSAKQFYQKDLIETIEKTLKETGLDPRYLELELTESLIMRNDGETSGVLQRLKEMGISIAIDDFGTGYSSLSYLKYIPVDKLKIVKSFVNSVAVNPKDAAIASAIVDIARGLGLRTIAEGVETKEQAEFLRSLKCDEVQGFLFSTPLPADEAEKFLARQGAPALKS